LWATMDSMIASVSPFSAMMRACSGMMCLSFCCCVVVLAEGQRKVGA
jgi:hypothetical protein